MIKHSIKRGSGWFTVGMIWKQKRNLVRHKGIKKDSTYEQLSSDSWDSTNGVDAMLRDKPVHKDMYHMILRKHDIN